MAKNEMDTEEGVRPTVSIENTSVSDVVMVNAQAVSPREVRQQPGEHAKEDTLIRDSRCLKVD